MTSSERLTKVLKYRAYKQRLKVLEERALLNTLSQDEHTKLSSQCLKLLKVINKLYTEITLDNQAKTVPVKAYGITHNININTMYDIDELDVSSFYPENVIPKITNAIAHGITF